MDFLYVNSLRGLKNTWSEVTSTNDLPFFSYTYNKNICKYINRFGFIRNKKTLIVIVKNGKKTLAILPFIRNLCEHTLTLIGDISGCPYADIHIDKSLKLGDIDIILNTIKEKTGINKIILNRLREDSILITYANFKRLEISNENLVRICLDSDYDLYLSTLSKSVRQNIRTAYNRISRDGKTIELQFLNNEDKVSFKKAHKLFLKTYSHRQSEKYSKQNFINKLLTALKILVKHDTNSFNEMEKSFVSLLLINGKVAGGMAGFIHNNTIYIPRLAVDSSFKFYSPGIILINELIKYLIKDTQIRILDLLRGTEKYKIDMGGQFTIHFA